MTTNPAPLFPPALLEKPIEERLEYFKNKIINHPKLDKATSDLIAKFATMERDSLIFLFGPTGVGKTTVRGKIEAKLTEKFANLLEAEPDRLPFVSAELKAPEKLSFDWLGLYQELLKRLDEPCPNKPRVLSEDLFKKYARLIDWGNNKTLRTTFASLVAGYEIRQPSVTILDEAHHLSYVAKAKQVTSHMEVVKSLTSLTKTPIIFFGTYDVLDLLDRNGQLARRGGARIHFERYRPEDKEFSSVIDTLQRHLPLQQTPDLLAEQDYLYERSAGCVGILKNWFYRALGRTLQANEHKDFLYHLNKEQLDASTLEKIVTEIIAGEERVLESPETLDTIRAKLNYKPRPTTDKDSIIKNPAEKKPRGRRRKVGERKPQRDPVGQPHD